MNETLEQLFKQSKFTQKDKDEFLKDVERQLVQDNHDISLDEKLTIVQTCFDRTVNSIIMQMPDLEELYAFKKCVRKFARVKMRIVSYHNYGMHPDNTLAHNIDMFMPFLIKNNNINNSF